MESFRKVIKGWLGKVLLVLFLTPLALVGIEGYFTGGNSPDTAKTVNGEAISKKQLESLTASFKEQYLAYVGGDETLLNQKFIEEKALDTLVARALILQQAKALGISLADAQIEQMIAQQPSLQENGQFSETLYANYLRSVGMTSQALVENLREDHALKMMNTSLMEQALVSQVDIQQITDLQTQTRHLHLASIKLDDYKAAVKVSEQDIANYYEKHKKSFQQVASVDVDYVLVKPEYVQTENIAVTEPELRDAYTKFVTAQQANADVVVQHILIAKDGRSDEDAKKRAEAAYAEIQKGESFANVAKKYSDDDSSKNASGVLEGYSTGVFGDAFDQAVKNTAAGKTSSPVKTDYGYHLIQSKKQTVDVASFEAEKPRLLAEVKKAKTENAFSDTVNALNELVVGSDALDSVTQEVKAAKIVAVNRMTLSTQHPVLSDPSVKVKLFNDDVKNGDRNASSSIQLANGDVVWIKVRNYHAAGEQTLAEAKARVKAKLIEEKALAAAKAKIQASLDGFKTQPAQTVLAKNQIKFEDLGKFTRSQGLLKREIERVAFSVPTPKSGMWSVSTAALPNELVVVAVSEVVKAKDALPQEQIAELAKLYQNLRGQQELDDYTLYLKSQAKIK